MTAFIAEAKRLGITRIPNVSDLYWRAEARGLDAEGLCITGCPQCRDFRNEVRAALAKEEEEAARFIQWPSDTFIDWYLSDAPYVDALRGYTNGELIAELTRRLNA
jgi:hypothetical protein